ncbi:MAG: crossover junction endodeoxyribonuclease RuvC [Candidatus Aminicenantes bacterium]|nr:crossover junction endodeoxyribonuclease RuvC [Candidatus Aminicenantes bacterium]
MIIAGFDPGSNVFGIGVVEKTGSKLKYIMSEELKLPKMDFNKKMGILIEKLSGIFVDLDIDETAIEDGFLGKNVSSMNTLSKVRGVVLATALNNKKDLKFYSPREIKISVTGNGNADKEQVKRGVQMLLGIKNSKLGYDESDALAVALCHSLMKRKDELIK